MNSRRNHPGGDISYIWIPIGSKRKVVQGNNRVLRKLGTSARKVKMDGEDSLQNDLTILDKKQLKFSKDSKDLNVS